MFFNRFVEVLNNFAKDNEQNITPDVPIWFQVIDNEEEPCISIDQACEGPVVILQIRQQLVDDLTSGGI